MFFNILPLPILFINRFCKYYSENSSSFEVPYITHVEGRTGIIHYGMEIVVIEKITVIKKYDLRYRVSHET